MKYSPKLEDIIAQVPNIKADKLKVRIIYMCAHIMVLQRVVMRILRTVRVLSTSLELVSLDLKLRLDLIAFGHQSHIVLGRNLTLEILDVYGNFSFSCLCCFPLSPFAPIIGVAKML